MGAGAPHAGATDGSVGIWNLDQVAAFAANKTKDKPGPDTKNPWYLFEKDKTEVTDLALSSDGATLVAAGKNGEIKIAKVQGREVLQTIKGHKTKIEALVLSPDGKYFATVDSDNNTARLSVSDDGPGIPADAQAHVFDRFFRLDGTVAAGSGLGLAIARELVGLMNGRIELGSRAGATTFTLVLPVDAFGSAPEAGMRGLDGAPASRRIAQV